MTTWKWGFFLREKCMILFWDLLILHTGLDLWHVFPVLLHCHVHFSCRMSPALGWIPALNATFGKPSWRKSRMAVPLCWHPTGKILIPAASIFLFSLLSSAVSWEQKNVFWRHTHTGIKRGIYLVILWQFHPAHENWTSVNPKYFLFLIFKDSNVAEGGRRPPSLKRFNEFFFFYTLSSQYCSVCSRLEH